MEGIIVWNGVIMSSEVARLVLTEKEYNLQTRKANQSEIDHWLKYNLKKK